MLNVFDRFIQQFSAAMISVKFFQFDFPQKHPPVNWKLSIAKRWRNMNSRESTRGFDELPSGKIFIFLFSSNSSSNFHLIYLGQLPCTLLSHSWPPTIIKTFSKFDKKEIFWERAKKIRGIIISYYFYFFPAMIACREHPIEFGISHEERKMCIKAQGSKMSIASIQWESQNPLFRIQFSNRRSHINNRAITIGIWSYESGAEAFKDAQKSFEFHTITNAFIWLLLRLCLLCTFQLSLQNEILLCWK